jgi:cytochrome bd-type quinol oxidase subunit 2
MTKSVLLASYSPLLAWREYGVAVSLQQEILFAFFPLSTFSIFSNLYKIKMAVLFFFVFSP